MSDLTLEERLQRLERHNRGLTVGVLVAVAALGGLLLMGMTKPQRVMEAQKFVVRDSAGQVRAVLGVVDEELQAGLPVDVRHEGPLLALYDRKGRMRTILDVAAWPTAQTEVPGLSLFGSNGQIRAQLSMSEGGPSLGLCDEDGIGQVSLHWQGGRPGLFLREPKAMAQAELSVGEAGQVSLHLRGGKGRTVTLGVLGLLESGLAPTLRLGDADLQPRIELGSSESGGARKGLTLYDAQGRPRAVLDVDQSGPFLALRDAEGREVYRAAQPPE